MNASPHIRNAVWQALLDAARLTQYYSALWNKYARIRLILKILMLVAAAGSFAAFMDIAPELTQLIVALLITFAVAYDSVTDHSRKVATLKIVSRDCARLESELRFLWTEVERGALDDDDVLARVRELEAEMRDATARAEQMEIRVDERLHNKSTMRAYSIVENRDVPA